MGFMVYISPNSLSPTLSDTNLGLIFTQRLCYMQELVLIQTFPFPRLLVLPQLKNPVTHLAGAIEYTDCNSGQG